MSLNATYADCAVDDGVVVVVEAEEEAAEEASLFALDDRVALDKMPPFFGLPADAVAVDGALQYGLSAALPIVSASSKSS